MKSPARFAALIAAAAASACWSSRSWSVFHPARRRSEAASRAERLGLSGAGSPDTCSVAAGSGGGVAALDVDFRGSSVARPQAPLQGSFLRRPGLRVPFPGLFLPRPAERALQALSSAGGAGASGAFSSAAGTGASGAFSSAAGTGASAAFSSAAGRARFGGFFLPRPGRGFGGFRGFWRGRRFAQPRSVLTPASTPGSGDGVSCCARPCSRVRPPWRRRRGPGPRAWALAARMSAPKSAKATALSKRGPLRQSAPRESLSQACFLVAYASRVVDHKPTVERGVSRPVRSCGIALCGPGEAAFTARFGCPRWPCQQSPPGCRCSMISPWRGRSDVWNGAAGARRYGQQARPLARRDGSWRSARRARRPRQSHRCAPPAGTSSMRSTRLPARRLG